MADDLDRRLRQLVAEVGDAAPDPATVLAGDVHPNTEPAATGRRRAVLIAAAILVVSVGAWALFGSGDQLAQTEPTDQRPPAVDTTTTTEPVPAPSTTTTLSVADDLEALIEDQVAAAEDGFDPVLEEPPPAASGEWGPELDAPPGGRPVIIVELPTAVGFVDETGPVGFVPNTDLTDELSATERDAPGNAGLAGGDRDSCVDAGNGLVICDHAEIPDAPMSQIGSVGADGSVAVVGGPGWGPWPQGGDVVAGYWRWVEPNDDGTAVLGQWSGECEVPSAHLAVDGVVRGPGITAEGELAMVPADAFDVTSLQSLALGWLSDGRAAIFVSSGPCSSPAPSGIYAVDLDGVMELLAATEHPVAWLEAP